MSHGVCVPLCDRAFSFVCQFRDWERKPRMASEGRGCSVIYLQLASALTGIVLLYSKHNWFCPGISQTRKQEYVQWILSYPCSIGQLVEIIQILGLGIKATSGELWSPTFVFFVALGKHVKGSQANGTGFACVRHNDSCVTAPDTLFFHSPLCLFFPLIHPQLSDHFK